MFKSLISLIIMLLMSSQMQADEFKTPLQESGWSELTTYAQMMAYLNPLVDSSALVKMSLIGTSVAGKPIPALFFSQDAVFASQREKKPIVLIICQQHGNEPSSKEAAMIVARSLLNENSALLNNIDLILVPQVNPDGADAGTRQNANDMDLNRNHVILSEPESNAVHQLFLDWMPEVTLDVHEYNAILESWLDAGYLKDAEEMLGGVTNLNIDPEIISFSRNVFIPETGAAIEEDGFRFHRYIVGDPFLESVVRYSTTAINDGRQSMGIYNSLSFIIEGKRYGNLTNEIERRTNGQVSAMINFMKTTDRHAGQMLSLAREARLRMLDVEQSLIQMDYYPDEDNPTLNFPVYDLNTREHTMRELDHFKALVKVKKSVTKPAAYFFPATETKLIELLHKHRIPMLVLTNNQQVETETYRIKHVTDAVDEEKSTYLIDLDKTVQIETLPAGSIIVPVEGAASNLIPLILEPESTWGIVSDRGAGKYRFKAYLREGEAYPVKRLAAYAQLDSEKQDHQAQ